MLVSKRPSMLKLFYTNASSFLNKIDELRISATIYEPDIICITESHLNSAIDNNGLSIDKYIPYVDKIVTLKSSRLLRMLSTVLTVWTLLTSPLLGVVGP